MIVDRKKKGQCIHFNGVQNDECKAGINYKEICGGQEKGIFARLPCLNTEYQKPDEQVNCEKYSEPTDQEIIDYGNWHNEHMDKMRKVMVGIKPWRDAHQNESFQEVVECPVCKGRLHLSISSYNSHVHGNCASDDCVSWME